MPQPAAVDHAVEELRSAYQEAWKRVLDEEIRLMTDPLQATKARRLMEMRRSIEAEMDALDEQLGRIGGRAVQKAYGIGAGAIQFDGIHREAVQQLVQGLTNDLLKATQHVRDTTKELIRQVAKNEGLQKLIEGKTALQAAKEMRKVLEAHKISAVVYADGSKHGLAEYANMQMRTTTAIAYNQGTLNSAAEKGTIYFEVSDGTDCGWDGHDDADKANGRIVDRDEALSHVISHPSCRRAFGGRPELVTKADARAAEQGTKARAEEQRAAEIARGRTPATPEPAPKSEIPSRHEAILKRHAELAGETPPVVPPVPVRADVTKPSDFVSAQVTTPGRGNAPARPVGPGTKVQVAVAHAQQVIDQIHLSPNLLDPQGRSHALPVRKNDRVGEGGRFERAYSKGKASDQYAAEIGISTVGDAQEFSYAHEFGHFFDFADFDDYGTFLTGMSDVERAASPKLEEFWKSIDESQAYQTLLDMRANPATYEKIVQVNGRDVRTTVQMEHVRYLQRPREVWARAYSQWIAEKSGDEAMLRGLARFVDNPYPAQWSTEDFAPISAALDALFRSEGLML